MGSASSFINSLPRDYSTASDAQLQQIINTSIIGQPWYDDNQLQWKYQQHQRWHQDALKEGYQIMPPTNLRCTVWERKCETLEDFALHSTIYEMKLRGFRAISVSEYWKSSPKIIPKYFPAVVWMLCITRAAMTQPI